ncbi:MAG: penicillin-binding transpeptidase domain-containing protein [Armatimonadota bacterium]|nr:penicillin-binding transpeptidase domain-containing protein [Armatimonadota bacterium]
MAGRIRRIATAFLSLFALQALWAGYWQVWRGGELATDARNPRLLLAEERIHRGAILDRRLRVLAETTYEGARVVRRYPAGAAGAHVVGYRNLRLGKTGLEAALDAELLGLEDRALWDDVRDRLTARPRRGLDVVTTLDLDIQSAAFAALGRRPGAVVVLDARDGAVLAMASRPSFDPNEVESQWEKLRRAEGAPLLNRVLHGLYPPGSTFKIVTMAAALSRGAATPQTEFTCPGFIVVRGRRITDFGGRGHGQLTLHDALVQSCNVAFIELGLRTRADTLREVSSAFGLGTAPALEMPSAAGHLPPPQEVADDGVAQMAFGQGSLLVSPLQMAVVAATIALEGQRPQPYMVREVRTYGGRTVDRRSPPGVVRVLAPPVARAVRAAMVDVVRRGTGRGAGLPGVAVAGKTGTATVEGRPSHAWFIAFAPADAPRVALAVVLEHGGLGGRDAAPVARRVLQVALDVVK